jgi:hypothetical protein
VLLFLKRGNDAFCQVFEHKGLMCVLAPNKVGESANNFGRYIKKYLFIFEDPKLLG